MKQVSAQLSMQEALAQAEGMTEVLNEHGSIIGFVISPSFGIQLKQERRAFYEYLDSLTSPEERENAKKSTRFYTTADVMKLLEND